MWYNERREKNEEGTKVNAYSFTIRHSTVTFNFTIYANTQRSANRHAMQRIAASYPNFSIYRCSATIY